MNNPAPMLPHSQPSEPLRVGFVLCPEFPLLSLTGFVEALRHAADRGDGSRKRMCSWNLVTAHGRPETASCGSAVSPDHNAGSVSGFSLIAVVGPLLRRFDEIPQGTYDFIAAARKAEVPVVGLCTGSFVLARAGLLDGMTACIHPYHALDFSTWFPDIPYVTEKHFVEEGGIATVPGGTSVLNYAAHVIGRHLGASRTSKVMHQMSLPGASWDIFGARQARQQAANSSDVRIKKAVSLMERTMEAGKTIADLAAAAGTSERQLERLFQKHFQTTPKRYWLEMRLDYCKWLTLNTERSITDVAFAGGFSDSAHFITQFKKAFGVPPGELRRMEQDRKQ